MRRHHDERDDRAVRDGIQPELQTCETVFLGIQHAHEAIIIAVLQELVRPHDLNGGAVITGRWRKDSSPTQMRNQGVLRRTPCAGRVQGLSNPNSDCSGMHRSIRERGRLKAPDVRLWPLADGKGGGLRPHTSFAYCVRVREDTRREPRGLSD